MAMMAWLLLAIGGLASLVGWILLLVAAFREGVGWGLALLFLSWLLVPVIVFAVKFWPQARPGVLTIVAGAVLTGAGWAVGAGAIASAMMAEVGELDPSEVESEVPTGPPAVEDASEVAVLPTASPTPPLALDRVEPRPTAGVVPLSAEARAIVEHNRRLREQAWGREIPWAEVAGHVGQTIEIHKVSGEPFQAVLLAADDASIQIQQRVGGGALTFTLQRSAVRQVRVQD